MDTPVLPNEIIDVKGDGLKFSEWQAEGFYLNLLERDLLSERFYYKAIGIGIFVWNIFSGVLKKFSPVQADCITRFERFVRITDDRLFVIYKNTLREHRISIVYLDWKGEKYEFIGQSQCVFNSQHLRFQHLIWDIEIFHLSHDLIGIRLLNFKRDER